MRLVHRHGSHGQSYLRCWLFVLSIACCLPLASAADFTWENPSPGNDWDDFFNWAGPANQFPNDTVDTATVDGAQGTDPVLNLDVTIGELSLTNGGDLFTGSSTTLDSSNNFELTVTGTTLIDGAGSDFFARESGTFIDITTGTLTLSDDGDVIMQGGPEIDILEAASIASSSQITGTGRLRLNSTTGNLVNNGTIRANGGATPGELFIIGSGPNTGFFDWDGNGSGSAVLSVFSEDRMSIVLSQNNDAFQGTIEVFENAQFENSHDWSTTDGSTEVRLAGGAGAATIGGDGSFTNGANVELNVTSGTGVIDTNWSNAGDVTISTGATLDIAAGNTVTLTSGEITGAGTYLPRTTTVTGNVDITVDTFDFDRAPTTVQPGGDLTINVQDYDNGGNGAYDSTLTINSAQFGFVVFATPFVMDGTLNLNNTDGTTAIMNGPNGMEIGNDSGSLDANLNVGGNGESRILQSPITFFSDADVFVDAGAILSLNRTVFNSQNGGNSAEFTGGGDLNMAAFEVNEATTIDMPGGNVFLDSIFVAVAAPDSTIDAPFTINTGTIDDYGVEFLGTNSDIDINATTGGQLNVNLDVADSWTINEDGRLNLNGDGVFRISLTGSPLVMEGIMTVDGKHASETSLTIVGDVNLPNAGDELLLDGVPLAVQSRHRLEGGTVSGSGVLSATSDVRLTGFGTIDTDLDFAAPGVFRSELRADDDVLNINGTILEMGVLGTADSDGTLNLGQPFSTSAATRIDVQGGRVTGAAITNDGEIRGFGTVASANLNNIGIISANGGLLTIDTVTEADIDGTNPNDGDGTLNAIDGSIRHVSSFGAGSILSFNGTINIGVGESLEIDGAGLGILTGGSINFTTGGAVIAPRFSQQDTLTTAGVEAVIQSADIDFIGGSTSTLAADLRVTGETFVDNNATITGAGELIVATTATLRTDLGAAIDTDVLNEGSVAPGPTAGTRAVLTLGDEYTQTATGALEIDLAGTIANTFDALDIGGTAILDGDIEVMINGGFDPAVGNSFEIITAGNVFGTFESLFFPALDPGEFMIIDYAADSVTLRIVDQGFAADFDKDGDVDADDLAEWEEGYGTAAGATMSDGDADMDGDVDGFDLLIWQQQNGSTSELAALTQVPEPTTLSLLAMLAALAVVAPKARAN